MILPFPAPADHRYQDIADKLEELADSISRLPEADPHMLERLRSFGAQVRAEQNPQSHISAFRPVDFVV